MEHIYTEAQLCINISKSKEISNIDILINLCLATSLPKGDKSEGFDDFLDSSSTCILDAWKLWIWPFEHFGKSQSFQMFPKEWTS